MRQGFSKVKIEHTFGAGFTLVATGFVILVGYLLIKSTVLPTNGSLPKPNQIEAIIVSRLREIAQAQGEYIKTDWDEDGKREYAKFLVHLWQSVSTKDSSVKPCRLINEKLAFVSDSHQGLDGYQYRILTLRSHGSGAPNSPDKPTARPLDFGSEWAAVAYPVTRKPYPKPLRSYLICCGNRIFSKIESSVTSIVPNDVSSAGWAEIYAQIPLQLTLFFRPHGIIAPKKMSGAGASRHSVLHNHLKRNSCHVRGNCLL